jgi:hypothetical protein
MTTCTRKGCGKTFDESNNEAADCCFHSGVPGECSALSAQLPSLALLSQLNLLAFYTVFHEGLKSWSCCSDRNRRTPPFSLHPMSRSPFLSATAVTSFDEFLSIPGCLSGTHSSEAPIAPPQPIVPPTATPTTKNAAGQEVYGAHPPLPPAPSPAPAKDAAKPVSTVYVEEQDDPEVVVEKGARCMRKACGQSYEGEDRENEECRYHAGAVSSWTGCEQVRR